MSTRDREELPWRHRPFPELVRLAWPIAVSMLSYSAMTVVDTLFVGRLGVSALAGVSLGGVTAFTLMCFGFGLLRGVKVLTSQSVGAGQGGQVGKWLTGGLLFALVMAVAMTAMGLWLSQQLHYLTDSAEAATHGSAYLSVRILATPFVMTFVAVREYRYGVGDTRSPMVASIVGNVANIALDYVFIVVLDYGVAGAAWSTVAGHGLELAVVVLWARKDLRLERPNLSELRSLLAMGLPTGIQFWLEVGSFALLTVIISFFGDVQLAAHQVALQVLHFAFLPTVALAEASSVLAGQAVGAGQLRLVRRIARISLFGAAGYALACVLVLWFAAPLIASAFTEDLELQAATVGLLGIAAIFLIPDGAAVVARGTLRGTGDVNYPAIVGIVTAWVCTPPLAWYLGSVLGMGAMGGWIGLCTEITLAAALFWWRLESIGWLPKALQSRERLRLEAAAA